MSSLFKRSRSAVQDAGEHMPPSLLAIGAAPFGEPQRIRLTALLRESAWPRGHMEMAELEGYLVALITWPVGIASGAWLPPIWAGHGWKVPARIAARSQYDEFVALIAGFMQDLDRQLSSEPPRFESSVLHDLPERELAETLHAWGRGFMKALTLGSQGFKGRSASACAAVFTVARSTSASAPFRSRTVEDVLDAVLLLAGQRSSRGPLGPLDPSARGQDTQAVRPAKSLA